MHGCVLRASCRSGDAFSLEQSKLQKNGTPSRFPNFWEPVATELDNHVIYIHVTDHLHILRLLGLLVCWPRAGANAASSTSATPCAHR